MVVGGCHLNHQPPRNHSVHDPSQATVDSYRLESVHSTCSQLNSSGWTLTVAVPDPDRSWIRNTDVSTCKAVRSGAFLVVNLNSSRIDPLLKMIYIQ